MEEYITEWAAGDVVQETQKKRKGKQQKGGNGSAWGLFGFVEAVKAASFIFTAQCRLSRATYPLLTQHS